MIPHRSQPREGELRIWQQNLNKSRIAQENLFADPSLHIQYDVILLQEPYLDHLGKTRTNSKWTVIYPERRDDGSKGIRLIILVNRAIAMNDWEEVKVKDTKDVAAVTIRGRGKEIDIYSVYVDCENDRALLALSAHVTKAEEEQGRRGMIWGGDFNRHHPMWDEDKNAHLFTAKALGEAQTLIDLMEEHDMTMALPPGIPTLEHKVTKNWTRPDQVLIVKERCDEVDECTTMPEQRGPGTDHLPIVYKLDLTPKREEENLGHNFREVEWDEFNSELSEKLRGMRKGEIVDEQLFNERVEGLTRAITEVIEKLVPKRNPTPHSKRWWSGDLKKQRRDLSKKERAAFAYRTTPEHESHNERRKAANEYGKAMLEAKERHWREFLENCDGEMLWKANKYLNAHPSDGGRQRIPTLKREDGTAANTNNEKSGLLMSTFFPEKPERSSVPEEYVYPEPLALGGKISLQQIRKQVERLPPYKAPGPDGIPNVVLQKAIEVIGEHLTEIYQAAMEKGFYHQSWRKSKTLVIRKPAKTSYEVPKAYRPIALLNTIGKLLSAIVADEISFLTEKHELLPRTHFGGRIGWTTTNSIMLLAERVRGAWRKGKVASVLFEDVEGAFPNTVTERLIHNLKCRQIPFQHRRLVENLLKGRETQLYFDGYASEYMVLENGIGQGDPLSMLLYLYYNADLLVLRQSYGRESDWIWTGDKLTD